MMVSGAERCPSGRRSTLGKRVNPKGFPGFESPSLRQSYQLLATLPLILISPFSCSTSASNLVAFLRRWLGIAFRAASRICPASLLRAPHAGSSAACQALPDSAAPSRVLRSTVMFLAKVPGSRPEPGRRVLPRGAAQQQFKRNWSDGCRLESPILANYTGQEINPSRCLW